ncbi:hypothetical protein CR513_38880, partial [Mucuna pruriens]
MEMDLVRAQIRESEETTMARFLHGLNKEVQRVMIVKEDGGIGSESSTREVSTTNESESLSDGSHYERHLLVVRGEEAKTERENIFHPICANIDNKRLVKKLALPTTVHPRLYKLQWLSENGDLLVDKQAKNIFTLSAYEDKVVCGVVPMETAHLLLGRPW